MQNRNSDSRLDKFWFEVCQDTNRRHCKVPEEAHIAAILKIFIKKRNTLLNAAQHISWRIFRTRSIMCSSVQFFVSFEWILCSAERHRSLRISHLEFCGQESLLRVTPQFDFGRLCDGQSHCRAHEGAPEHTETSRTLLTRFSQAMSQEHATMVESTYACGRDVLQATIQIHLPKIQRCQTSRRSTLRTGENASTGRPDARTVEFGPRDTENIILNSDDQELSSMSRTARRMGQIQRCQTSRRSTLRTGENASTGRPDARTVEFGPRDTENIILNIDDQELSSMSRAFRQDQLTAMEQKSRLVMIHQNPGIQQQGGPKTAKLKRRERRECQRGQKTRLAWQESARPPGVRSCCTYTENSNADHRGKPRARSAERVEPRRAEQVKITTSILVLIAHMGVAELAVA